MTASEMVRDLTARLRGLVVDDDDASPTSPQAIAWMERTLAAALVLTETELLRAINATDAQVICWHRWRAARADSGTDQVVCDDSAGEPAGRAANFV